MLLPSLAIIFAMALPTPAEDRVSLAGTWSGESNCTGALPACHDEKVIYTIATPDASGRVSFSADKVVDGHRIAMGAMEFQYDSKNATLKSENRGGVWSFHVKDATMQGTLTLASGEIARNVKLKKD